MRGAGRIAVAVLAMLAWGASADAQSFVASGRFEYVDKPWNWNGWTGASSTRPIRRADVTVINAATSAVMGQGFTQADGSFAIACTSTAPADVVVRCDADTLLAGGQRVRVTTELGVEYSTFSPVFPAHSPGVPLNVGVVTAQPMQGATGKQGSPFNLLDMGVAAAEFVAGPEIGAAPSATEIRLMWPGSGGSFTAGAVAHLAEDDGYDDGVILHELGHCVHNLYSDSDSPGGSHTFGAADQDPRLAFAEGYATFFAALVEHALGLEALYVDMDGGKTQPGFWSLRLRLETVEPWAAIDFGEADEVAVACTLYDMIDDETWLDALPGLEDDSLGAGTSIAGLPPQAAWWNLFVGPLKLAPNLAMYDVWDGWFALYAADAHLAALMQTWENRQVRFWKDSQEPDNAAASAAPLAPGGAAQWTGDRTLYYSAADPPAPGSGDADNYSVPLVKGDVVTFQTRYPGGAPDALTGCDTFLDVYDPSGALVASADGGGTGRNAAVAGLAITASGNWTCVVRTINPFRRYGRYNVQCAYVSQNHAPQITSGPAAVPQTIDSGQSSALSVTASDADAGQTLSYEWTPLNGGSIVGSGPAVTFVAPSVAVTTTASVQVVVTDNLGAPSAPGIATLTIKPGAAVCAAPAAVASVGAGKPGLLGPPLLVAQNLPVVPSSSFALHLFNAFPNLTCYFVFGFSVLGAPFDGGTLYPTPNILFAVNVNSAGQVHVPIPLSADAILCGFTLHVQAIVLHDPGATGSKHSAQSNLLSCTFGS